jgi:hypothetical protein
MLQQCGSGSRQLVCMWRCIGLTRPAVGAVVLPTQLNDGVAFDTLVPASKLTHVAGLVICSVVAAVVACNQKGGSFCALRAWALV